MDLSAQQCNIQLLANYAAQFGYSTPSPKTWFPGRKIQRMNSSEVNGLARKVYPGRIRIGKNKSDFRITLWAYLQKQSTTHELATCHYIMEKLNGLQPVSFNQINLAEWECDEWTKYVAAPGSPMKCGSLDWHKRIRIMVLIALLLAGYYDGPATINDTAMAAHKQVHAPLWQAVREHINGFRDNEVQTEQEMFETTIQHSSTFDNQKRSLPTRENDKDRVIKRARSENSNTVNSSKDAANKGSWENFYEEETAAFETNISDLAAERSKLQAKLQNSQHLVAKLEEEKRGCIVKLEDLEIKLEAKAEDARQTKERCTAAETSYIKQSKTLGALREEHADLKERYVTLKATLDNSKAKVHEQANTMHDLSAAKAESDEKIANQKKKIEALQANHIASCTQIADLRAKQAISHKTITEMKEEIGELQSEEERHRQDRIRHAMDTCRPLYEMRRRKLKSQGLSEAEAQQKAEEFYCVEFKRHL